METNAGGPDGKPTSNSSDAPKEEHSLARRLAIWSGAGYILLALLPFAVVGETWGMVWFGLALPFSILTMGYLDFEPYPLIYVLGTTMLAAAALATLVYVSTLLLERLRAHPS